MTTINKLIETLCKSIELHLDAKYTGSNIAERVNNNIPKSDDTPQYIYDFIINIYTDIYKRVYLEEKGRLLAAKKASLLEFFGCAFSDEEIDRLYKFTLTEEGAKLLRNLDLIGSELSDSDAALHNKILVECFSPQTDKVIKEFINKERDKYDED